LEERLPQSSNLPQQGEKGFSIEVRDLICSVSDAAKAIGVSESRIRHWSRAFSELLESRRSKGNYRLFTPRDLRVFKKIKRLYQSKLYTTKGVKFKLNGQEKDILTPAPAGSAPSREFFILQERIFSHLHMMLSEFQYLRREMREDFIGNLRADMEHLKLLLTPPKKPWWRFWSR